MYDTCLSLTEVYQRLSTYTDLSPTHTINSLFSTLVSYALTSKPIPVPEAVIQNIQHIASRGESALESYWSTRIAKSKDPWLELLKFPYIGNYKQLISLEWKIVQNCANHDNHSILFCGGGPLPISAILLAHIYHQSVTVIDTDLEAVKQARALIDSMKLNEYISVIHADIHSYTSLSTYSLIYVAALVGKNDAEKEAVFSHLKNSVSPNTHILTRSSWGNRTLLYPPLPQTIQKLFQTYSEFVPSAPIINSVVLLQA